MDDSDLIPVHMDTDRSALKVSIIRKNNEIIYHDSNMMVREEMNETELDKTRSALNNYGKTRRSGNLVASNSNLQKENSQYSFNH